ncbi:MAG: hypothetical protein V1774_08765 [Candidatus Eisenbacteria bacterium]
MKRTILAAFVVLFMAAGTCWAQDKCAGCGIDVSGYLAPNLRMIDQGEDTNSNLGFGMAFNRVTFSGMQEVGPVVKKIGWKVEADFRHPSEYEMVYAYVQAYFNEMFSARFGHVKEQFSREWLHPTYDLLTVDRLVTPFKVRDEDGERVDLDFASYSFGLELVLKQEKFGLTAGAYDGQGEVNGVVGQDPVLDYGLRAIVMPTPELQIGAAVQMKALPGLWNGFFWDYAPDDGSAYPDDPDLYQTNSGLAYEIDADFTKAFNEKMSLRAQAEFGMGDNGYEGPDDADVDDEWEDYSWFKFQYFYVKALLMINKNFGIHGGFASFDPNTNDGDEDDGYVGVNDSVTKLTPGITYRWSDFTRTQVEVQMITEQNGVDGQGKELDDFEYTHFVLQQVLVW